MCSLRNVVGRTSAPAGAGAILETRLVSAARCNPERRPHDANERADGPCGQPAAAARYSLVERAPERQNISSGRGSSASSVAIAAISSGDW